MLDLTTPQDVAEFLAGDPAEHEHERAIDSLADVHGNTGAFQVWTQGQALHERRQVVQ